MCMLSIKSDRRISELVQELTELLHSKQMITLSPDHADSSFLPPYTAYKCITDQRERLEETLPLILGFILALIIVITLTVYHFHLKMTASQPQLPRDRSMYKNM